MGDTARLAQVRQICLYFGLLTLSWYVTAPEYLTDIPTSFMLKNYLHAAAPQVSVFRLLTGIPLYLCFVPGLLRDLWNPFGLRDRGFFLLFAPFTAAVYMWMSLSKLSFAGLLIGTVLTNLLFRFIVAAYYGLAALIGQEDLMCGRLSAVLSIVANVAILSATFATGPITERLTPSQTFLLAGGATALIAVFGIWSPQTIFKDTYEKPEAKRASNFFGDIKRLMKHKAVYPAMIINFLWYFNPGLNTPMQFHLTEHLHTPDATYSYYFGTYWAAMIPAYILYGFLCTKVPPKRLFWWSMGLGVPQMIPLLWVRSAAMVVPTAGILGLVGGMATVACYDLAMRSCPAGLQGTLMMLTIATASMAVRGGDFLGANLYASSPTNGFFYCVVATTAVYATILLVLPTIPKHVVETADGVRNPALEADVLAETGG